jgi:hypothetical protein
MTMRFRATWHGKLSHLVDPPLTVRHSRSESTRPSTDRQKALDAIVAELGRARWNGRLSPLPPFHGPVRVSLVAWWPATLKSGPAKGSPRGRGWALGEVFVLLERAGIVRSALQCEAGSWRSEWGGSNERLEITVSQDERDERDEVDCIVGP